MGNWFIVPQKWAKISPLSFDPNKNFKKQDPKRTNNFQEIIASQNKAEDYGIQKYPGHEIKFRMLGI